MVGKGLISADSGRPPVEMTDEYVLVREAVDGGADEALVKRVSRCDHDAWSVLLERTVLLCVAPCVGPVVTCTKRPRFRGGRAAVLPNAQLRLLLRRLILPPPLGREIGRVRQAAIREMSAA